MVTLKAGGKFQFCAALDGAWDGAVCVEAWGPAGTCPFLQHVLLTPCQVPHSMELAARRPTRHGLPTRVDGVESTENRNRKNKTLQRLGTQRLRAPCSKSLLEGGVAWSRLRLLTEGPWEMERAEPPLRELRGALEKDTSPEPPIAGRWPSPQTALRGAVAEAGSWGFRPLCLDQAAKPTSCSRGPVTVLLEFPRCSAGFPW